MAMTKKCYACICSAKEQMKKIQSLASDPSNLTAIRAIASKFNSDFGDVDPDWKPGTRTKAYSEPAPAANPSTRPAGTARPAHAPAPARKAMDPFSTDPNYKQPLF